MKKWTILFVFILAVQQIFALEKSMLNLKLPTALEVRQAQFFLQHRFRGYAVKEKPLETFFGMESGANVGLGFRTCVLKNLEVIASYTFWEKEYVLGVGYALTSPGAWIKGQIDLQYFTYKRPQFDPFAKHKSFAYFRLDLASKAIGNFVTPVINIGYDTDYRKVGLGVGIDLGLSEKFSLIGEYFPRLWKKDYADRQMVDSFAFGLKVQTWGHHFLFMLGNSTDVGTRRMMHGSNVKDLFLGIGIQRLLEF
jgi:hypothetical protein